MEGLRVTRVIGEWLAKEVLIFRKTQNKNQDRELRQLVVFPS